MAAHEQQVEFAPHLQDLAWVGIQKRTFTGWMNSFLVERMMKINDLETDLENGIPLINLLEIISDKKLPNYNKNCKIRPQKLENCGVALKFCKDEGLRLVGIGPEDLVDHRLKLILGLIWTIILRYQIQKGGGAGSAKNELLEWVRSKIPEYNINNFTNDWSDGKALNALDEALCPGNLNLNNMGAKNPVQLAREAMDNAEDNMGIPKIMLPEDMACANPDELSTMTYISYFRDYDNDNAKRKKAADDERNAVPGNTVAYGPGLEKAEPGKPADFTIEARNAGGRKCPVGGENFDIQLQGPTGPVPVQCRDNGDGTYSCQYVPNAPGDHVLNINLKGQPIKGNPWRIDVRQRADARMSSIEDFKFNIIARNGSGQPLTSGGENWTVQISDGVQPRVVDNNNGTYTVSYSLPRPGNYSVSVMLDGVHVRGSPMTQVYSQ